MILRAIRNIFYNLYKKKNKSDVHFSRVYSILFPCRKGIVSGDMFTYSIEHPLRDFFFFFSLSLVGGWITTLMAASNTALTFYMLEKYSMVSNIHC
jgi:hypothetical protein